jgi:hypothetical protein
MNEPTLSESELLKAFFALEVCQRATQPLKNGVELAIHITDCAPLTLEKKQGKVAVIEGTPKSPDMTFWIGKKGVHRLVETKTEDIGEIGIHLIKLMLDSDPEYRLKSKVHIGTLQLLTHGYLGVLPLGGSTVMKFLASHGFSNLSKIKEAISKLRG